MMIWCITPLSLVWATCTMPMSLVYLHHQPLDQVFLNGKNEWLVLTLTFHGQQV